MRPSVHGARHLTPCTAQVVLGAALPQHKPRRTAQTRICGRVANQSDILFTAQILVNK
jgi:hypothetical protein